MPPLRLCHAPYGSWKQSPLQKQVRVCVCVCDTFLCAVLVLLPRVSSAPGCCPCCLLEKQLRLEKGEKGKMHGLPFSFSLCTHSLGVGCL